MSHMNLHPHGVLLVISILLIFIFSVNGAIASSESTPSFTSSDLSEIMTMPRGDENAAIYYCEIFAAGGGTDDLTGAVGEHMISLAMKATDQGVCNWLGSCLQPSPIGRDVSPASDNLLIPWRILERAGDDYMKRAATEQKPLLSIDLSIMAARSYERMIVYSSHLGSHAPNVPIILQAISCREAGLEKLRLLYQKLKDETAVTLLDKKLAEVQAFQAAAQKRADSFITSSGHGPDAQITVDWKEILIAARSEENAVFRREAVSLLAELYLKFPTGKFRSFDAKLFMNSPEKPDRGVIRSTLKKISTVESDFNISSIAAFALLQ